MYPDKKFGPRKGLEGPFTFVNGRVLYYDVKEGQYYDPTCDWYVGQEEIAELHGLLMRRIQTS